MNIFYCHGNMMVQHCGVKYSADQHLRSYSTDEGTLYHYLNYLDLAVINVRVVS